MAKMPARPPTMSPAPTACAVLSSERIKLRPSFVPPQIRRLSDYAGLRTDLTP
jgi:hypothetical protein